MAVDWSHLPKELLEKISLQIPIYSDYIRFRAVCRSFWSSAPRFPYHLPPQLPWLLLPVDSSYSSFFNLQDRRVHYFPRSTGAGPPFPFNRHRCCGSSHGWLAATGESPEITLVNPLTMSKVDLPPLTTFPNVVAFDYANVGREYIVRNSSGALVTRDLAVMRDSFIEKIVLSSGPADGPGFVAVALLTCGDGLAFCRSDDSRWTFVEGAGYYNSDVIFRDGSFYALSRAGLLAVITIHGPFSSPPEVNYIPSRGLVNGDLQYLVEAGEDLFLVTRYIHYEFEDEESPVRYRTDHFDVFKLDLCGQPYCPRWVKLEGIGDCMLFVGRNSSLAFRASEFPGCLGNCIYYTDDFSEDNSDCIIEPDMGIYRLYDGSIENFPSYSLSPSFRVMPLPIWLSPNPR
ncbi:hypothetical protein SAY87_000674 [Trapa incisa]|uniref:KIB1-4 beta-propeller domain-containing protein n=1 Tax=Trapa incisa TaxID=236973 RepID=A0AAN7JHA8_9MYRT|nr:hypothetical protein SAY87_000674 [Trapa incisa]